MAPPREGSGERVGWALVSTGPWTLGQVLTAFGRCRHSRPVALVGADRARTSRLARRHGIPETSVYDAGSFDELASNAEVEVVYLVVPEDVQADFAARAARAGKHVLCERPLSAAAGSPGSSREAGALRVAYRSSLGPPDGDVGADPLAADLDRFSLSVRRISARSGAGTALEAGRAAGARESA